MEDVRVRVAVYVVRESGNGPELLVFDHRDQPEAGTQVPAGGVDPGETLEQAALREVLEETGLSDVSVFDSLGVQQRPHPHTGQPRVTIFYHAATTDRRDRWSHEIHESTGDDAGMTFECFFVPLADAVGLLPDAQDEFLSGLVTAAAAR